jgi:hypothetical protein
MTTNFIIRLYRIDHVKFHINSINLGPIIAINTRLFMETAVDFSTYKTSSLELSCFADRALNIFCNENHPNELFILNLFRLSTSTCFGHVCYPSSGGIYYVCTYTLTSSIPTRPAASQLKHVIRTNGCICKVNTF